MLAFDALRHASTMWQSEFADRNLAVAKPIPAFAPVITIVLIHSPLVAVFTPIPR
jgi:hypothetical protein